MTRAKHDGLAIPGRVILAHEPPFTLGTLRVDPATRQVEAGGRSETLEPRVMQVLVALARADGAIVTRDELIERCWDGRIVTDDAINRVLSRIRQVAAGFGGGTFALETIARVGYRLTEEPGARAMPLPGGAKTPRSDGRDRRSILVGAGAVVAAAGAGILIWQRPWKHRPAAEAVELFRRGDAAQKVGVPSETRQAASFFEQAVQVDPLYGEAWGALALARTHSLDGYSEAELASMPGLIRSAAQRALELDPDNADAQLALACIKPYFRNWAESEAKLRNLARRFPNHWLCNGRLAMLLYQVGRFDDGIVFHKRVMALEPLLAGPYAFTATALSNRGRVEEAELLFKDALKRWPAHPLLWFARFDFLLFNGRPQAATAFVTDPDSLPSGMPQDEIDRKLRLARAVETRNQTDLDASIEDYRRLALADVTDVPYDAGIFAMLGRFDLTFESLERYYFNRGASGSPSPIGPMTRRWTDNLFSPPMAPLRGDPRFGDLLRRTGLEDYWRRSAAIPDFRRPA